MKCPICQGTGEVTGPTHSTLLALFSEDEVADLRRRYPRLDLEYEAQHCTDYWAEGRKRMRRPRSGFRTWLKNANAFLRPESAGGDGEHGLDAAELIKRYGLLRGGAAQERALNRMKGVEEE